VFVFLPFDFIYQVLWWSPAGKDADSGQRALGT